jgi:hypothetical protein
MHIDRKASLHEGSGNSRNVADDRFNLALADLKLAADKRHVEPICAAYHALKAAGGAISPGQIAEAVNNCLGPEGMTLIVSAYSHRECFMCSAGQSRCDQCGATGLLEKDRPCPKCDGTGHVVCGFCRGTGWADRETIPSELRKVVLERQLVHVRRKLKQFGDRFGNLSKEKLRATTGKRRQKAVRWLMCFHARLSNIIDSGIVADQNERSRMSQVIAGIDSSLESLRH